MNLWKQLWRDESGVILTAETVMVGSIAVLGGLVGLNAVASSVNGEMVEMASAIRSLDQSYAFTGQSSCRAWTAGSYYVQPKVEESLRELCGEAEADVVTIRKQIDEQRAAVNPPEATDAPPANELPPKQADPEKKPTKKSKKKAANSDESAESTNEV
jgi:hypothetical protein